MTHSKKFKQVKTWYDIGTWDKDKVRQAVEKGWITATEYTEITGEPY